MPSDILLVNEVFGPTFQGEGRHLGRPCVFVRLAGCNLSCAWCDTPYSWDWSRYDKSIEVHRQTVDAVADRVRELAGDTIRHVVVSGGEPLLQGLGVFELVKNLRRDDWTSELETAGTVMPPNKTLVDHFTVSPKLVNSHQAKHTSSRRLNADVLPYLNNTPSHCFKFVVQHPDDYDEIDALVDAHHLSPVYIMPEGVDGSTLNTTLAAVADGAVQRNYTLTTRLQILTYGQRRAV